LINIFRLESQPFQETLVCGWVAGFEQFVPPLPLRLVQADLLEQGDPLVYVHIVFHMSICITIFASVQLCHGHDKRKAKG
jgi:hypothetical protein